MEAVTLYLPPQFAASVRSVATQRGQRLPDFIMTELQRLLRSTPRDNGKKRASPAKSSMTNFRSLSDEDLMKLTNARMQRSHALQMHRLIHSAGARELSIEENKLLDTLLEIHNEVGIKKAQAIREAIQRGLLPPIEDEYWNSPSRRKFSPRKRR